MQQTEMSSSFAESSDCLLWEMDVNIPPQLECKNLTLHIPTHLRSAKLRNGSKRKEENVAEFAGVKCPVASGGGLTCNELQKALCSALSNVELMYANNAERFRDKLQEIFYYLRGAPTESVRQLIDFSTSNQPLSHCISYVLNMRRRILCKGFELPLQDFKEWLRLSLLLREPDTLTFLQDYAQKLGPYGRRYVENALSTYGSSLDKLCQVVMDIPVPIGHRVTFDGTYYNLTLNDLIAMGDEGVATARQSSIPPHAREGLVEWMLFASLSQGLQLETFFLAASILDRYSQKMNIKPDYYYVVACAVLLLASKVEERNLFSVKKAMRRDGMTYNEDVLISVTDHVFEVLDCNVVLATLSSVGLGLLWQQEPFACARQRSYLTYILVALAIRVQYKSYNLSALATAAVYMTRLKFGIGTGCPSEEVLALLPIINDALTCDSNAGRKGSCSLLKLGCFGEV